MRILTFYLTIFIFLTLFISCSRDMDLGLVDTNTTRETRNLYKNLMHIAPDAVLFGHQNTLAYGVHWRGDPNRSDVKDVTGSFPAVYGWDAHNILPATSTDPPGYEAQSNRLRNWIRDGYSRGGVITMSWHMWNPVTGRNFYDTTPAVYAILPGGDRHEYYRDQLDTLALFFNSLTAEPDGELIPVIFRPFHEHNGDWFWWCKAFTTEEDFITLWQFTIEYLRDEKNVHNLLYAISPDRSRIDLDNFREDFLWGYPGDEYVDIIGIDNYWDLGHPANKTPAPEQFGQFIRSLEYTVEIAREKNKLAALTEAGLEAIPDPVFWTETLLAGILANDITREISWVLVWRNANMETDRQNHYYAPYPGQVSAEDFIRFQEHPFVLFEDDVPDLYKR